MKRYTDFLNEASQDDSANAMVSQKETGEKKAQELNPTPKPVQQPVQAQKPAQTQVQKPVETKTIKSVIDNIKNNIKTEKDKIIENFTKTKIETKYGKDQEIFWLKDPKNPKSQIGGKVINDQGEQVNVISDDGKTKFMLKKSQITDRIKMEKNPEKPVQQQQQEQQPVQQPVQQTA
jgi:hypothetical protein